MTETMKLQKATFTATAESLVTELIYSDHEDLDRSAASVVIRVPSMKTADPKEFVTAKAEALVRVRELLADEIAALPKI